MKAEIKINGSSFNVEITREQAKEIGVKEKPKRFRAEIDVKYYYIEAQGYVLSETETHHMTDKESWDIGNYYKTKEEAIKARDTQLAIQRVKDYIIENDLKNGNEEIGWDKGAEKFRSMGVGCFKYANIIPMLDDEEDVQQVIDNCSDDLKLIFNI